MRGAVLWLSNADLLQALLAKMWLTWTVEERRCWDGDTLMLQAGYGLPLLCRSQGLDIGLSNTGKFISNRKHSGKEIDVISSTITHCRKLNY